MKQEKFGLLRYTLFPVHSYETKKVGSMAVTFFMFAFTYHILRQMKDSVFFVVSGYGMEAMPFIKFFGLIPMSVLMTLVFSRIKRRFSRQQTVYIITSLFLGYFFIFSIFIYPNRSLFQATGIAKNISSILPKGAQSLCAVIEHWYAIIFFSMAELWGSILLHTAVWGFANEVTKFKDARRIYPIMGVSINLAGILGGIISANYVYYYSPTFIIGSTPWDQGIIRSSMLLLTAGILGLISFTYMNLHIDHSKIVDKDKKQKTSLIDDIKLVFKNKDVLSLAIMIFAFGFVSSSVEVFWKEQTRKVYTPESGMFAAYMSNIICWTSALATLTSLFVSGTVTRYFGWTVTALLTPIIMLFTVAGFFAFSIFQNQLSFISEYVGCSSVELSLIFGSASVCLARVCKYSLFDNAKELAFVALGKSQAQYKGVIDGLVSRMGKASSSIICSGLLLCLGSLSDSAPAIALVSIAVSLLWIKRTIKLGDKIQSEE